jgi:hypothetical protein
MEKTVERAGLESHTLLYRSAARNQNSIATYLPLERSRSLGAQKRQNIVMFEKKVVPGGGVQKLLQNNNL